MYEVHCAGYNDISKSECRSTTAFYRSFSERNIGRTKLEEVIIPPDLPFRSRSSMGSGHGLAVERRGEQGQGRRRTRSH